MDEDLKTKLEEAKSKVVQAELGLFDIYFNRIRESYIRQNEFKRRKIVQDLTSLIEGLDDSDIISSRGVIFSHRTAREIRERYGRAISLSKEIGVSPAEISRFECGKNNPGTRLDTSGRKYLDWLKSQGYNPYNL
ncbi:MAG: hypothetical protein AABX95_01065 [Nanoarchaeota archaeon]